MIGTINVKCNAAHPEMALPALYSFAGSPSSIRVSEVPKKIGNWQITNVRISAVYPDGTTTSADCVLVGGVWVGTISGSTTVGTTQNGYTIYADGIDENENPVVGYVLGKGDLTVLESDGEEQPSTPTTFIKLLEEERETPIEGDMWPEDGSYYIYQNGQANPLSGGVTEEELTQKLALKADVSALENYMPREGDTSEEGRPAFNAVYAENGAIIGSPNIEGLGPDEEGNPHYQGTLIFPNCIEQQSSRPAQTVEWYKVRLNGYGEIELYYRDGIENPVVQYDTLKLPKSSTHSNQTLATQEWVLEQLSALQARIAILEGN